MDPELNTVRTHQAIKFGNETRIRQTVGVARCNRAQRRQVVGDDHGRSRVELRKFRFQPCPILSMLADGFLKGQSFLVAGPGAVGANQPIVDHGPQQGGARLRFAFAHHGGIAPERGGHKSNAIHHDRFAL